MYETIRQLSKKEKATLLAWLLSGRRERTNVDIIYDRARRLSGNEKLELIEKLGASTGLLD